jgi:hypothetical protein
MVTGMGTFHEQWYADSQLHVLAQTYERTRGLSGAVLEIGCWEGKSAVTLARTCYPEILVAVDTWKGNMDEDPQHPSVLLAGQRDVYATFLDNMKTLTRGNFNPVRQDCHEFLAGFVEPIKFCHIDASHDYASVRRTIEALLPKLVPLGVLCGDDFLSAHAGRADLDGGVERAVRKLLPKFEAVQNFWHWQQK